MFFLYRCFSFLAEFGVQFISLFNTKLSLFVKGRKQSFHSITKSIAKGDKVIWFHTASVGEFEQGLPLIKKAKKDFPNYKILVTFFSPSGYEHLKDTIYADVVCYLPWDSKSKVNRFLDLVQPKIVIFVKYEFWPNYLRALKQRRITTILISSIFRERQVFFKWYGEFMRNLLFCFDHIFVQDENSKKLLESIKCTKVTIAGDTRFDRVLEIQQQQQKLDFVETFKNSQLLVVIGSSWPEDEEWLLPLINNSTGKEKYLIAPHNIKENLLQNIEQQLSKKTQRFSTIKNENLAESEVLILDTIGLLTRVYAYADIVYVGGAVGKTGLHNTLEPAVYGIPIIIGPKFKGFKEAEDLVDLGGIFSITSKFQLQQELKKLLGERNYREKVGVLNYGYVKKHVGATNCVAKFIKNELVQ